MVLLKPRKLKTSQLVHNLPHQLMVSVGKPSHRETRGASILTWCFRATLVIHHRCNVYNDKLAFVFIVVLEVHRFWSNRYLIFQKHCIFQKLLVVFKCFTSIDRLSYLSRYQYITSYQFRFSTGPFSGAYQFLLACKYIRSNPLPLPSCCYLCMYLLFWKNKCCREQRV